MKSKKLLLCLACVAILALPFSSNFARAVEEAQDKVNGLSYSPPVETPAEAASGVKTTALPTAAPLTETSCSGVTMVRSVRVFSYVPRTTVRFSNSCDNTASLSTSCDVSEKFSASCDVSSSCDVDLVKKHKVRKRRTVTKTFGGQRVVVQHPVPAAVLVQ